MQHDTDPSETRALELQALRLRNMTEPAKLALMASHSRMVVALADADVKSQHPDWSARRIRIESSKRWLPENLHTAAFGAEMATWKP